MEDFEGYEVIQLDEQAGRPKLVKFTIKQNHIKWTIKNEDTGKLYYIKMAEQYPIDVMHAFLASIRAYETEKRIKTEKPVDYIGMARKVIENGKLTIWIPANRETIIKNTWTYKIQENTMKFKEFLNEEKYNFKSYSDFMKWKDKEGKKYKSTDKIDITVENIGYKSILDVMHAFEE